VNPSAHAQPAPADQQGQEFRFVARQPIFNREQQIFGYELLFRDGVDNFFKAEDPEAAARSTLDSSLLVGLDVLCDGQRAFINCTRDLLLKDCMTLLPSGQAVVEVLETVEPDDLVIAACDRLKVAGYTIALDDFVADDPRLPLVPLADILKVDFARTTLSERAEILKEHSRSRMRVLAEKVETREEFLKAKEMGFVYFQGFYLRHPEILKAKEIPQNRLNYLRLLEMVSREELVLRDLEELIKREASVLYRLLRYLNSPAFGFATTIRSVRHALAILGEREVRRWIRLVALVSAGMQKSSDLVLCALGRARFCELLSPRIGNTESDLFLVGLLSMDGRDSRNSDGAGARTCSARSRNKSGFARWYGAFTSGVSTDAGAGGGRLGPGEEFCGTFTRRGGGSGRDLVAGDAVGASGFGWCVTKS
jgi:EAL and modified HD-GYP domain-containing signal transduction protein